MNTLSIICFIIGFQFVVSAQEWDVYTSDNSLLPNAYVTDMVVDYENNTWIAVGQSLVKLKNKTLEVYNSSNSTLPDQAINDLYLDKKGKIWILFEDKIYSLINDKFEVVKSTIGGQRIAVDNSTKIYIGSISNLLSVDENDIVDTIFRPSSNDFKYFANISVDKENSVWFRRHNDDGIRKYNTDTTILYSSQNTNLDFGSLSDLTVDSSDNIWICGYKIIYKFDSKNNNWIDILSQYSEKLNDRYSYNDVEFDSENNAYIISSDNYKLPSNLYRIKDNVIETINFDTLFPTDLFAKVATRLAVNFDKQIFIYGSEYGIFQYTPSQTSVQVIATDNYTLYPNPAESQISVDLEGGLLIAHYKIIDTEGRVVLTNIGDFTSTQKIEIHSLPVGAYVIELTTATGEIVHDKFVKR